MEWSSDKENFLEAVRQNSVIMAKQHRKLYTAYKDRLKYFRIPVIIISGVNSVVSVGMNAYLDQQTISAITCLLALIVSVIGSIELFLNISAGMEQELNSSKDFYILGIDIFKVLSLCRENRPPNATGYLEEKYGVYTKLIEASAIVNSRRMRDALSPLPVPQGSIPPSPSMMSIVTGAKDDSSSDEPLL